jgi:hypothetical protein
VIISPLQVPDVPFRNQFGAALKEDTALERLQLSPLALRSGPDDGRGFQRISSKIKV